MHSLHCCNPTMCSALYCVIQAFALPAASRRPVRGANARCALPNQFRCQTSISLAFAKKPALGRWKPAGTVSKDWVACPLVGVASKCGGDQETSNESGGAERDRTADLMLAKHALSQLSYSPKSGCLRLRWWAWVDSNYRPHPYQGCALTN